MAGLCPLCINLLVHIFIVQGEAEVSNLIVTHSQIIMKHLIQVSWKTCLIW